MKKIFYLNIIGVALLASCSATRIIKKTSNLVVIQGTGDTNYEATDAAREEAKKNFPAYKEKGKPDCNKEVSEGYDFLVEDAVIETRYSCVLQFVR